MGKYRKLTIDGKQYAYNVGKSNVAIVGETGFRANPLVSEVTGRSCEVIAEGRHNGNQDGMVEPHHVVEWIKAHQKETQ